MMVTTGSWWSWLILIVIENGDKWWPKMFDTGQWYATKTVGSGWFYDLDVHPWWLVSIEVRTQCFDVIPAGADQWSKQNIWRGQDAKLANLQKLHQSRLDSKIWVFHILLQLTFNFHLPPRFGHKMKAAACSWPWTWVPFVFFVVYTPKLLVSMVKMIFGRMMTLRIP